MLVQPAAELRIRNRYWFMIGNVFGYFAQRQSHGGEDKETRHQGQGDESFRLSGGFQNY